MKSKGFTLIELVLTLAGFFIVLFIIAAMAAGMLFCYDHSRGECANHTHEVE